MVVRDWIRNDYCIYEYTNIPTLTKDILFIKLTIVDSKDALPKIKRR